MQVKKFKNETDEERLVREQMLALQQEEERMKTAELTKARLRARQLREESYAKLNGTKIHNQWRKIMRLAKVENLRRDIEVLSQNHEREVDRKDAVLQMLDRDLEDAEEQFQTSLRAHSQTVDSLLDLEYTSVKKLRAAFDESVRELEEEFDTERAEIANNHARLKKEFGDMIAAMEAEFHGAEQDAWHDFESQREEIKNRNSEEYNVLKLSLENIIEELEHHFEQAHQAYLASTDARTQSFKELTERDTQSATQIERRMRKLVRLQDALAHWRNKIASNSREWEERNSALRGEKDVVSKHYHSLKARMNNFRSVEAERLKALTLDSGAAIKTLKEKVQAAERMIKLAELNRKLETEQEKVVPFQPNGPVPAAAVTEVEEELAKARAEATGGLKGKGEEEDLEVTGASPAHVDAGAEGGADADGEGEQLSSQGLGADGTAVDEWDYLNNFYKRFNKVELDRIAIDREKQRLESENVELRNILKQYLDGVSVNEDVINNPSNPLLVVNNRLHLNVQSLVQRDVPRTVVEASHVVQERRGTALRNR